MTNIVRKNAFNRRPFYILSRGKALDFKVNVDLQLKLEKAETYKEKIQKKTKRKRGDSPVSSQYYLVLKC